MPFLEILTRTYKRPKLLQNNMESLRAQTDDDFTQTLLNDDVGRGVAWSYTNMASYAPFLAGDYIWILDDDDMCIRPTLIAELKHIAAEHDPDVIMVKMDHRERGILPDKYWQRAPQHGDIGCSAFVVKRPIWQAHAGNLGARYAGDFDFITSIFACDYEVYWHDVVASRVQRISLGATE